MHPGAALCCDKECQQPRPVIGNHVEDVHRDDSGVGTFLVLSDMIRWARWGRREMRTTMSRSSRICGNSKCRGMPPFCNQKGPWVRGGGGFGLGWREKREGKVRTGSGIFPLFVLAVSATLGAVVGQNATTSLPETTPPPDLFVPVFSFRETNLRECVTYSSNSPTVCSVFMNADAPPKIAQPNYKQMGCTQDTTTQGLKKTYSCLNDQDPGCNCKGECVAVVIEGETLGPPSCMNIVFGIEDTWTLLPSYIVAGNGDGTTSLPGEKAFDGEAGQGDETKIRVIVTASYGTLDVQATQPGCLYSTADPQECVIDVNSMVSPTAPNDRLDSIRYLNYISREVDSRQVIIEGGYSQVSLALEQLRYRPGSNVNSNSLRSRIYSSTSSKGQAFEQLKWGIFTSGGGRGDFLKVLAHDQLLHIAAVNDEPFIDDPAGQYQVPGVCVTDPFDQRCHFGQFFAYEDSSDVVSVSGLTLFDVDIYESCTTEQQECRTVDVIVRAQKGTIDLNTRSNLEFYSNTRNQKGFTSAVSSSVSAIKAIKYQTETMQNIEDGSSQVKNYNTQNEGNTEVITLVVSDQGNSGDDNLSRQTTVEIKVTIVAVNDAPTIKINVPEFVVVEDDWAFLPSIVLSDPDVNENIASSLAQLDWTGVPSNQQFLNKIALTMAVKRGSLRLAQTRGITLMGTEAISIYSVYRAGSFVGHDTCRVSKLVDDAAKLATYAVDGATVGSYRGVCAWKNLPPSTACPTGFEEGDACTCATGKESTCECRLDDTCAEDGTIIIYLNRTEPKSSDYVDLLRRMISTADRTCGGLPRYTAPNNFSFGKDCASDFDCVASVLPTCTYGVNCTCCANISDVCSSDADCSKYEGGSPCGCMRGGVGTSEAGMCGPYCDEPINEFTNLAMCLTTKVLSYPVKVYGGTPCTYKAPLTDAGRFKPVIRECRAPVDISAGSGLSRALELVLFTTTSSTSAAAAQATRAGSKKLRFMGSLADVNAAIQLGVYQTDTGYNRLFRPPVDESDPNTFDITNDDLDVLTLEVSDLGNSGGDKRLIQTASAALNIRAEAVNNRPRAKGPSSITVTEDVPFHFQNIPLIGQIGLNITDPDVSDYGFDTLPLTVNLSCSHGRIFLNETFLKEDGVSGIRVSFKDWGSDATEYRGYHSVEGNMQSRPVMGDGCQMLVQCSDGQSFQSNDNKFGFFSSTRFGVVYAEDGCGFCRAQAGNKFLSIEGVMNDLNRALSFVTYLPDPNFNTRAGQTETFKFSVDDNGAIGGGNSAHLSDMLEISVVVESVNDRPIIGRRVEASRSVADFTAKGVPVFSSHAELSILEFNNSHDDFCMKLVPSSEEYTAKCGPEFRRFIDVDEDTPFVVSPDVLWIEDVDSEEAETIAKLDSNAPAIAGQPSANRYCCAAAGPQGCKCGQPCVCGASPCACPIPSVCSTGQFGRIMVDFHVNHGRLSFFPPPGRPLHPISSMVFLTNASNIDVKAEGAAMPCPNQRTCMVNNTRITLATNRSLLQSSLIDLYLTYRGAENFYGEDELTVWVSDMNHTDECYINTLVVQKTIKIRVVAVNDAPRIKGPTGVMMYGQGARCYADFVENAQVSPTGVGIECLNSNQSKIPNGDSTEYGKSLYFKDVDLADRPRYFTSPRTGSIIPLSPLLTLLITVGSLMQHQNAGTIFFPYTEGNTYQSFEMFRDSQGLMTLAATGTLNEINALMSGIRYDVDPIFQGYVPLRLSMNDNGNLGECRGNHACGFEYPCADHKLAGAHTPPRQGVTSTIIDVSVGVKLTCDARSCETCSALAGCGWCPSACAAADGTGGGACMLGSLSAPTYQDCGVDFEGKGWGQCVPYTFPYVFVAGAAVGGFIADMIILYFFSRWIKRRYGNLTKYIGKKRDDFLRIGRKINVIPDAQANYPQFFLLLSLAIVMAVILPLFSRIEPICIYSQSFVLTKASTFALTVDKCDVRYIPASSALYPDHLIESLKVRVAVLSDPSVKVSSDFCSSATRVDVANSRENSVKYVGYYCSVEILVPTGFVIPNTVIQAAGNNVTTIRGGDLDPDSKGFSLDFGPNPFSILGRLVKVRIARIAVKDFTFKVAHGSLFVENLTTTGRGIFESTTADLTVTTSARTTIKFEQKSENLACISGPSGSVYVDNSCYRQCEYFPSDSRRQKDTSAPDDVAATTHASSTMHDSGPGSRRADPWLCSSAGGALWNCTDYDPVAADVSNQCPVGSKFPLKSLIPQIPGCFDLDLCTLNESPQCLCKVTCDMRNLTPTGTCDDLGRCCQTKCAGASYADVLPTANQPRCGREIDPIGQPWCDRDFDQKWDFVSETGMITVQVFSNLTMPMLHTFKGSTPTNITDISDPVLVPYDKEVLDSQFHAGGATSPPNVDLFSFDLIGPGTPEKNVGQFVWVASMRFLMIVPWLLDVVSVGLLKPRRQSSTSQLRPSFCPAISAGPKRSDVDYNRLVTLRNLIMKGVENQLGSEPDKITDPFPADSILAYIPEGQTPMIFKTDKLTLKTEVLAISAWDNVLMIVTIALAFGFPVFASLIIVISAFVKGRIALEEHRKQVVLEEQVTNNLGIALRKGNEGMNAADFVDCVGKNSEKAMAARTNFMHMTEVFVGVQGTARSLYLDLAITVGHIITNLTPVIIIYSINTTVEKTYSLDRCRQRLDICYCLRESSLIGTVTIIVKILLYVYFFICVAESAFYYLGVELNKAMKVLRKVFYVANFIIAVLVIDILLTIFSFIIIGVITAPVRLAPYVFALLSLAMNAIALSIKMYRFKERVTQAVEKRIMAYKGKVLRVVPRLMLAVILRRNIRKAFLAQGVTYPKIIISVCFYVCDLALVYCFLFVGFTAFTDPANMIAGIINTCVVVVIGFAAQQIYAKQGEEEDLRHQVDASEEKVVASMRLVFDMVTRQVMMARQLFIQMERVNGYDTSYGEEPPNHEIDDEMSWLGSEASVFDVAATNGPNALKRVVGVSFNGSDLGSRRD